ncbi:MAG TPA: GNAT family N-acetyltransferase [Noviherbaspirillum sp.]|nr:GNAT family N-acetyltransferase [Noviherbaspirillum sp.]
MRTLEVSSAHGVERSHSIAEVRIYNGFEELPAHCGAVFETASTTSGIFLSLPWFRNLAATAFGSDEHMRIYSVESGTGESRQLLLLPMCHKKMSKKRFASRRLVAAGNYYTSLFSPIAFGPSDDLQKHMDILAKAIAADTPHWDSVDLHPLETGTAFFNSLQQAFRTAGMAVQTYFCFGNWYLEVNGRSYQDYFNSLPSRLKNTLKRKTRQLSETGRLRLEIISEIEDIDRAIVSYEKVYTASWKKPEDYPAFIPGLLRMGAEQGWLRLGIAYIDGEPAAAQIWFVNNHIASIFKLAYDERFSSYSVGSILTARLMQHVIDVDWVKEVDYLTGDDDYKRDWMSHRRERWGIVAFNLRTLNGTLAAIRHLGGAILKRLAARSRTSPLAPAHATSG